MLGVFHHIAGPSCYVRCSNPDHKTGHDGHCQPGIERTGKSLERASLSNISGYIDLSMVNDYASVAVAELIHNGNIEGSNNNINPQGTATRSETAVI